MRPFSKLLSLAVLAAAISSPVLAGDLGVGSSAPALKVAKWIKGGPVNLADGKVHVVEFWATWCGPCKESIPHLTELAHKYKGKVDFVGVSVWEEQNLKTNSHLPKVAKFVKDFGAKMDYNVAADGFDGTMAKTWMAAANQNGIPAAFVVDKNQKIVWIGHPMDGLDKVLDKVLAGKYDLAAAKQAEADKQRAMKKQMALSNSLNDALQKKDYRGGVSILDKAMADDPAMEEQLGMAKFSYMLKYDEAAAQAYGEKLSNGVYKENGMALNSIAWSIVDPEAPLKKPNYALAVRIAQKAVTEMGGNDAFSLDTLALAQFRAGNKQAAIATGTKAVTAAKATKGFEAAVLKELTDRLAMYKK